MIGNLRAYPPQQLPGIPQELGEPQHPPPGSKDGEEADVLWADITLVSLSLPHSMQFRFSSSFPMKRNSFIFPHFSHWYS